MSDGLSPLHGVAGKIEADLNSTDFPEDTDRHYLFPATYQRPAFV
jgi:hypothetical protein